MMNVIFDIGMVLVDFYFEDFVRSLVEQPAAERVLDAMWRSGDWIELDTGVLSDEEVLKLFIARAPECEKHIRLVFAKLGDCVKMRDYAIPLIQRLKAQGHKVYYLSNYFSYLMHAAPWALEFISLTDGGVFSCFEHITKPDPEIYLRLCQRYSLDSKQCVFIDDTQKNVDAAKKLGMKGILCTTQTGDELFEQITALQ